MPSLCRVINVLVTGFGSFGRIDPNPSWQIVEQLPSVLPGGIRLTVYPSAVPVAYRPTFDLVNELYNEDEYDLILHIGVNQFRQYFAVENSSAQSAIAGAGYHNDPDVYNETFSLAEQKVA